MKRYTIEVVINEGNDEFWDEINETGKTGCDDVLKMVLLTLQGHGIDVTATPEADGENTIRLTKYEEI